MYETTPLVAYTSYNYTSYTRNIRSIENYTGHLTIMYKQNFVWYEMELNFPAWDNLVLQ